MFKNKLKNYFTIEIIKSYFFVLATLSLLIWVTQSARLLYLVTDSGLSISTYSEYVFFLIPKSISQLMIISFLISLFLSIMKLQNNKELEIYWLSGISKQEIVFLVIKISLFLTLLALFFFMYLAPVSSKQSRDLIANSEFSLVNALVKKNNFNSPLRGLTIFVNKNDNQGNLEKVYIFENNKTIISKKGRVLNEGEKNFLELTDGVIHEKNAQNNITTIKFEKTLFDFTKYQSNITTQPKLQERDIFWIVNEYKKTKNSNVLYEIHKRLFKPFFIPIIAILCCFTFYANNEKINSNKIKILIFSLSTFLIIFLEVLLNLSVVNVYFKYLLYCFPFFGSLLLYFLLSKFLKSEATAV
jgi:lipopolysaccharide export system permease protein